MRRYGNHAVRSGSRGRQDRLRTLRLGLILAVIKGAEPTQLRYLSSLERYEKGCPVAATAGDKLREAQ